MKPAFDLIDKCPQCGYKQVCPCGTCTKRRKKDKEDLDIKPWIWIDGELVKCANCGLIKHAGWWEDWAHKCLKAREQ
jgi:hypothetical protein